MSTHFAFSRPDKERWLAFLKFMGMFYLLFFPVYFGGGHLASKAQDTFGLYLAWEPDIPLLPWMIWPYLTLFSLFVLPLFHMSAQQISVLSRQSSATLVATGVIFVLVPTHSAYPAHQVGVTYESIFRIMSMVDTPHNLVPSLHVAFSTLILLGSASLTSSRLAWAYRLWLILLSASTVFVHQHHILDVASGFALAIIMRRLFPIADA